MGPGKHIREVEAFLRHGDPIALSALVDLLTPIIEARAARMLSRRRKDGRDVRQELPDLVQEVFIAILEDDAKVLRAWSPERGLSLPNFIGLIAEREVSSILRSGRRNPYTDRPEEISNLDREDLAASADAELMSRELVVALLDRMRDALSPLGLQLFELLVVSEESVESVCATMQMKPDAVYAWRSRLSKMLKGFAEELLRSSSRHRLKVENPSS